jgi:hypothetical protein
MLSVEVLQYSMFFNNVNVNKSVYFQMNETCYKYFC